MRKSWDEYFIGLARAAAERSTCPKRHVGAVLVDKANNVISTGYNGAAPGAPHCDDVGCLNIRGHCKRTIHAERNAITRTNMAQRTGSKVYTTDFPCFWCAHLIANSGIVEVIYDKPYKSSEKEVLALFEEEGIVIRNIGP